MVRLRSPARAHFETGKLSETGGSIFFPPRKREKGDPITRASKGDTERNKWSINDIEVIAVLISMSSLALSTNRSLDLVIFFSSASKSIR